MSQLIPPDIASELQGQPPQSDIHSHSSQSQPQANLSSPTQSRPDPNLDPKLSGDAINAGLSQSASGAGLQLGGLDSTQILNLLRHLPGVFNKLAEQGSLKESAAEQLQQHLATRPLPGPSSNFTFTTTPGPELQAPTTVPPQNGKGMKRKRGGKVLGSGDDVDGDDAMEDWTRQRKDNHKEVERRRRGNINEGINELARIVPNGSGEKAKGAILNRAVQYIHHLKENEARNIEKWTLEKLLMDQAMGDLQAQLEEMRRLWDEERQAKERALLELDVIRAGGSGSGGGDDPTMSNASVSMPSAHLHPYERRVGGSDIASRDRAYHPSDRHHHTQRGPQADTSGARGRDGSEGHNPSESDVDLVERHLGVQRDADVAGGHLGLRDPDVIGAEGDASGSADLEADAEGEGEEGDEEGDEERSGKRKRFE